MPTFTSNEARDHAPLGSGAADDGAGGPARVRGRPRPPARAAGHVRAGRRRDLERHRRKAEADARTCAARVSAPAAGGGAAGGRVRRRLVAARVGPADGEGGRAAGGLVARGGGGAGREVRALRAQGAAGAAAPTYGGARAPL